MDKSFLDPVSMALLLLTWPLLLNLLTIAKTKFKSSFYALSILSTGGMAFAAFSYGPTDAPIRLGRWISFSLDSSSWMFVIVIYTCWCMTLLYSIGYIKSHLSLKAESFHRYMNATLGFAIGAGMANNFFTLLFFYCASILTIVPLLTLRGDEPASRAAKFYIHSVLWPVLLIALPAIALNFPLDASFDSISIQQLGWSHGKASLILALIVIGLSTNCVAPFHLWLPRTSIAPAPVTAMIHSVASVQVGSVALLKVGKHVYGEPLLGEFCGRFGDTGWLLYLCGFTSLYTAYRAWKAQNLKERFSFSTVGQLSYIITAILIGTQQSTQGAMLHIVTHSIAKLNLFFFAGACLTCFGSVHAPQVANGIPGKRWLGVTAVLSGLSICGFPLLIGFHSKDMMLLEEVQRHQYSAAAFLLLGSLLNFVYIYPLIRATIRKPPATPPLSNPLPGTMTSAICLCTALIILMSLCPFLLLKCVGDAAQSSFSRGRGSRAHSFAQSAIREKFSIPPTKP
jgi:multicomponent Na+:H+ antiporter subunit D